MTSSPDAGMKTSKSAGDDAGNGKRQGHVAEDLHGPGAEIHRRLVQRHVEFFEIGDRAAGS